LYVAHSVLDSGIRRGVVSNTDQALLLNSSLRAEAIRLYQLLRMGKTLDEAAKVMRMAPSSLVRHERDLRRERYLSYRLVYDVPGEKPRREYAFPREDDISMAS
jgi:hypothetical protein